MSQLTLVFCRYSNVETMKSCQLYRGSTSKTQCCSTQKIRVTADLCEAHTQDTQRTCFYPGKKRNMNGILHKCIVAADDASSNNQITHKCCLNHEWTNMFRFGVSIQFSVLLRSVSLGMNISMGHGRFKNSQTLCSRPDKIWMSISAWCCREAKIRSRRDGITWK